MNAIHVRKARPEDAPALAEMANDLNEHVGIRARPFTAEIVLRDGFGAAAAFTALIAEHDAAVAGYAFYALGYNTDFAGRSMWLYDLFVRPASRGHGVGYALMAAVAAETVREGGVSLEWGVHDDNAIALEFYRRIGAGGSPVRLMSIGHPRLRALAEAAV